MADLRTLFHNPESLSDSELRSIKRQMQFTRVPQPVGLAIGAAIGFQRTKSLYRAAPFAVVGLIGGSMISNFIPGKFSSLSQPVDEEIMAAFEQKYVDRSLNASGYGNNALNAASHTKDPSAEYKKPY